MPFTPKDWRNSPDASTPLSADAMEDLEVRVTDYADSVVAAAAESKLSIDVTKPPYNLTTSTPDAGSVITAALTAAATTSGITTVRVPPTLDDAPYTLGNQINDPTGQTGVAANIWLRKGIKLDCRGARFKLKNDARGPAGATQLLGVACCSPYAQSTNQLKRDTLLEGGEFDWNGDNQTLDGNGNPRILTGVFLGSAKSSRYVGVTSKNLRGTLPGPPGETFHFDINYSWNCSMDQCEADGSGATDTSTGFSQNNSVGCDFDRPKAHNLANGMGIALWQSARMSIIAPDIYSCAHTGLNMERCNDVRVVAPLVGGRSALIGNNNAQNPFFPAGQQTLGCGTGIDIHGCTDVQISDPSVTYSTDAGIRVRSNSGASGTGTLTNGSTTVTSITGRFVVGQFVTGSAAIPAGTSIAGPGSVGDVITSGTLTLSAPATANVASAILSSNQPCSNIRVEGGKALYTVAGVTSNVVVEKATDGVGTSNQSNVFIDVSQDATVNNRRLTSSDGPVIEYEAINGNSGVRHWVAGVGGGGGSVERLVPLDGPRAGVTSRLVDSFGRHQFAATFRTTRQVSASGNAQLYDDAVEVTSIPSGGLTLTLADIVTLVSNQSARVDGTVLLISDVSGTCSTAKPIRVASFAAGKMQGGLSTLAITRPFGSMLLRWSAAADRWIVERDGSGQTRHRFRSGSYTYCAPGSGNTTAVMVNGEEWAVPWSTVRPLSIARIGAVVRGAGSAGALVRLGVRADDGDAFPGALLLDAGTIDGTSVASQEITLGSALLLPPGDYWTTAVSQGATTPATVECVNNAMDTVASGAIPTANGAPVGYRQTGVTGALSSAWSGTTTNVIGTGPRLFVRSS